MLTQSLLSTTMSSILLYYKVEIKNILRIKVFVQNKEILLITLAL